MDLSKPKSEIQKRSKHYLSFGILLIICIVLFLLDILIGSAKIPIGSFLGIVFHSDNFHDPQLLTILKEFRIPRGITAILAGMALSVSGLQMQTIFRNPLAGPYVLGISSGASLGVAILVLGVWPAVSGVMPHFPGN